MCKNVFKKCSVQSKTHVGSIFENDIKEMDACMFPENREEGA